MEDPVCSVCDADSSPIWRRSEEGKVVCLECYTVVQKRAEKTTEGSTETPTPPPFLSSSTTVTTTRKRKGGKRGPKGGGGSEKASSSQPPPVHNPQQGRRSLIKGKPIKAPAPEPRLQTSNSVLHKGTVYETGDIVSLLDYSGGIYYALIRGFLIDQYATHYAILKWVLPKTPNPTHFDPRNFILGPDDDEPKNLELLDFVCHSPNSKSFRQSFSFDYETAIKWLP